MLTGLGCGEGGMSQASHRDCPELCSYNSPPPDRKLLKPLTIERRLLDTDFAFINIAHVYLSPLVFTPE